MRETPPAFGAAKSKPSSRKKHAELNRVQSEMLIFE
jgi:hypothetical protein